MFIDDVLGCRHFGFRHKIGIRSRSYFCKRNDEPELTERGNRQFYLTTVYFSFFQLTIFWFSEKRFAQVLPRFISRGKIYFQKREKTTRSLVAIKEMKNHWLIVSFTPRSRMQLNFPLPSQRLYTELYTRRDCLRRCGSEQNREFFFIHKKSKKQGLQLYRFYLNSFRHQ